MSAALERDPAPEAEAVPLIELRQVSRRFVKSLDAAAKVANLLGAGLREEVVRAVDNVDLDVMDGEFLVEETTAVVPSVGGGNFLILAESQAQALAACETAIDAMRKIPNVIMPFPGGVVRSGSKVGSRYKALNASTNDAYCPTLKGQTRSMLDPEIESVMEIVIDGLSADDIRIAMKAGIQAATSLGAQQGIRRISAGNYGGKLGPFLFPLHEVLS